MNQDKTGKFIKILREEKGLTQEQFAKMLFISRNNLSDIENGKTALSPDKANAIANLCNVSILDIYSGEKINDGNVEEINKTVKMVDQVITKKVKKRYVKFILGLGVLVLLLIMSFFIYYFFYSYNSVKFYKVIGESDNFYTNNGMLVVSKENIYFTLNVNDKNNEDIKFISLKYKENDEDVLIQRIDDTYFYIVDFYNYNAYFDYKTIIEEKGQYYIEVEYEDKKEVLNLSITKEYENKNVIFKKSIPITDGDKSSSTDLIVPDKIKNEFTFSDNFYTLSKKNKKMDIMMGYMPDANLFIVEEDYKNYYNSWEYYLDTNELYFVKKYKDDETVKEKIIITNDNEFYKYFFDNYFDIYFE